jgi:hypothetical protein
MILEFSTSLWRQSALRGSCPVAQPLRKLNYCLLSVVFLTMVVTAANVSSSQAQQRTNDKGVMMGYDYHLHLLDLKTYRHRVLPAYRLFWEKDDASRLIKLLTEVREASLSNDNESSEQATRRYDEAIGILEGTIFFSTRGNYQSVRTGKKTSRRDLQYFVKTSVGPDLLLDLCVPANRGVSPHQNMGSSPLIPYLYAKSKWIKDLFTSLHHLRGGALEIQIGDSWSEVFAPQDIREFTEALIKVPVPDDPELRKEYDNLAALLKVAAEDPDLAIILTVL